MIEQVISGLDNCAAYLDDIIITGKDDKDHLSTIDMVLSRIQEFGFKCRLEKCQFFKEQVNYLGFIVNSKGKVPDPERIQAINMIPTPKNVKELESFIGKVNYYSSFIGDFSSICEPLNALRRKDTKWVWTKLHDSNFKILKDSIAKNTLLVHYDSSLPLLLATDASNYGIGAVILHRCPDGQEKPIAHACKTLTSAERNYSQIEKEALAIVYGVKKFHQYLAGRQFELITDHKPLLTIFSPSKNIPMMTANRLQRWAITLMAYTYTIKYKNTRLHSNADCLSRLPSGPDDTFKDEDSFQVNAIHKEALQQFPSNLEDVQRNTSKDKILQKVFQFISNDWHGYSKDVNLDAYFQQREKLHVLNGCLLRDLQVVVPEAMRYKIIQLLHRSHQGTVKMKMMARRYVWWPKMDKEISEVTSQCSSCCSIQADPKHDFKSWPIPNEPWDRIHIDFAGPFWGEKWLLVIDAKSKYPFVMQMGCDTTSTATIKVLSRLFNMFGFPKAVVSDNGRQLISNEMQVFLSRRGIEHIQSAPFHPQSNGEAERFVRTFKEAMTKFKDEGKAKEDALFTFLFDYRNSPNVTTDEPPAELFLKRKVINTFDSFLPHKESNANDKVITKFLIGSKVFARNYITKPKWIPGTITNVVGSRNYIIQLDDGRRWKRHQDQLRIRTNQTETVSPLVEIHKSPDPQLVTTLIPNYSMRSPGIQVQPEPLPPRRSTRSTKGVLPQRYR